MRNSVCYFGSYDPKYARNRIIKKGLIVNKIQVFEVTSSGLLPTRYLNLTLQFLKHKNQVNSIIVGFPGHYDVPLAYVLGKIFSKKVIYDIFASTYETYVLDRKVVRKNSFRSKFFYSLDWLGLKLADHVVIDTLAHGKFYSKLYGLNPTKQILIYVGSDADYFYPRKVKEETDVLFYGSYQPLQGVDVIIKAASTLPKIKFKMIGEGQTKKSIEGLARKLNLKNVRFVNWLSIEELAQEIAKAKITLGIFGNTQKANVVIPNKVYDYLASKKCVITKDTEAVREVLTANVNAMLVKGEHNDLTEAIRGLVNNSEKRFKVAQAGYEFSDKKFRPEVLVTGLVKAISQKA